MLVLTIYSGNTKIEFHNSFLGQETIVANGDIVSSKHSFTGTQHDFSTIEEGNLVHYQLMTGVGLYGITVDLFRNGSPILESSKSGCPAIGILIILVLGCIVFLMGIIG